MNILIDCDDVLLDWQRGFRSWLRDTHAINPHPSGPLSWQMTGWLGLPEDECLSLVKQFNSSADFGSLFPISDSINAIRHLRDKGHSLYVITSCGAEPEQTTTRQRNLLQHFGDAFDEVICVPLGVSKATHLATFEPSVWIEDNYHNALCGLSYGHKPFMLRRNHNRHDETNSHSDIAWVDDWWELISRLS